MSLLVYIESHEGSFNKKSFELATYASKTAQKLGTEANVLLIGQSTGADELGKYGIKKIFQVQAEELSHFDSQVYAHVIAEVAQKTEANVIVLGHTAQGKALIGRLAVRLDADSVSGATSIPEVSSGFFVEKGVFSGKAKAVVSLNTERKVMSLMGNSIPIEKSEGSTSIESLDISIPSPKTTFIKIEKIAGDVPLTEAGIVVSAGRGMKGPENWDIVEELAKELGAATACSRPVADTGWRPHHEHVGQTGVAIRPNLYIAIGISGAIQHLAGVNNSKTIVVINKDPEAPFFKAADYGVVADLFDVVPRLTTAIKEFKAEHN